MELAFALQRRLRDDARAAGRDPARISTTIVASSGLVPSLAPRAGRLARAALEAAGIAVIAGRRAERVTADAVVLDDGSLLRSDVTVVSTAARAPAWLATLGLPVREDGSLIVGPTLQTTGDEAVFAAGDCAFMEHAPREKAGVFAVRQALSLAANLAAVVTGGKPAPYMPQRDYLALLSTADGRAIAARGRFAVAGRAAWWWKDWIDRRFMARFKV